MDSINANSQVLCRTACGGTTRDNPRFGFDPSKPAVARVFNYWLGGKDNFAADREEADRLTRIYPLLPQHARDNRLFVCDSVTWLSRKGIRQFIDAGSGLPTGQDTHHVAQAVDSSCRVVYVDNDPMVISHAAALLARDPGVTAFSTDLADPDAILAGLAMMKVFDLSQPVAVLLATVLDYFDAGGARRVVASLADAMAAGSYIAISVGCWDKQTGGRLTAECHAATLHNHSAEQIAGFLSGLVIVDPPGLCDAHRWLAGRAAPPPNAAEGHILAAVARKA